MSTYGSSFTTSRFPRTRANMMQTLQRGEESDGRERGAPPRSGGATSGAERRSPWCCPRGASALPQQLLLLAGNSGWEQTHWEGGKELSSKSPFNTSWSSKHPDCLRHFFSCRRWQYIITITTWCFLFLVKKGGMGGKAQH